MYYIAYFVSNQNKNNARLVYAHNRVYRKSTDYKVTIQVELLGFI